MATAILADHGDIMTREEAKRILRRLELDAYSAVVTAFRAQGDIDRAKKSLLSDLATHLSISTERHRAEVRRVVNDERLNAVAECMHGNSTCTEWSIEGRRLVSLMPRLVPQTVFTAKATAAANQAVEANNKLPTKTEIEVLPLPTKVKSGGQKGSQSNNDKDAGNSIDERMKCKKKSGALYSKPANKQTSNKSLATSAASLKTTLKSDQMRPLSFAATKSQISPIAYTQKPIIVHRSPVKSPACDVLAQSTFTQPLAGVASCEPPQPASISSPMIKVISNTLTQATPSCTVPSSTFINNSITQKIKFKTPLPKSKVKAAKFKPMVPMSRPMALARTVSFPSTLVDVTTTNTAPTAVPAFSKTVNANMAVKVVQVAKNSALFPVNRPVVTTTKPPSQGVLPTTQGLLSFNNNIASSISQQIKNATAVTQITASATQIAVSAPQLTSPSIISSLSKSVLASKSMPLTTGFKMIAVTTVIQGTTQVKTVYIATPIMSLSKSISPTSTGTITTPAVTQSLRRAIPNALATNLQTVVARSINPSSITQFGKVTHAVTNTTSTISLSTPSFVVGKPKLMASSNKTTGVLGTTGVKTTLSGHPQGMKLFTAITRAITRPQQLTTITKNIPVMPHPGGNTTVSSVQAVVRNIHAKGNTTHGEQIPDDGILHLNNTLISNQTINTIGLVDEASIATEQITASATADTDDLAFLNAGEKFLEQLSAKMTSDTGGSEVLSKNENFMFTPLTTVSSEPVNSTNVSSENNNTGNHSSLNHAFPATIYDSPASGDLFTNNFNNSRLQGSGFISLSNGLAQMEHSSSSSGGKNYIVDRKLNMSISGLSSKLNISPLFSNTKPTNNLVAKSIIPQQSTLSIQSTLVAPICNDLDTTKIKAVNFAVVNDLHKYNSNNVDEQQNNNKNKMSPKKRKANDLFQEPSSASEFPQLNARTQASWVRGAANLLQRVCRYRGASKQKGEMNAASWFTRPVDPNEAPGYYDIIKTPMDFGKIRTNLEEGQYTSYKRFHEDMLLVKSNCHLYNPENHTARKDCDDVFSFFETEFQKLLERWEKHHVAPHKKLKLSNESSAENADT